MELNKEQRERYSRHLILKEVGQKGMEKIRNSKILIIGAGGLGSPAALYLAAAGVGHLGLADKDKVDLSNLQRQILHGTKDVGIDKTLSGKEKIAELNPDVEVLTYPLLDHLNIRGVIKQFDFVIDGTDNFAAKFLINDACVMENVPFSHGGILRFEAQTMTIDPKRSACYRCLFGAPPKAEAVPTCSEAGVLGAVAGILGTIQAAEALKSVLGIGKNLFNELLIFDALSMHFRKIHFPKSKTCPVCAEEPTITALKPSLEFLCR